MKRKTLIKNPKLAIQSDEDGVWLMFQTSDRNHACINMHVHFRGSNMIDQTLRAWAVEYAKANPPK